MQITYVTGNWANMLGEVNPRCIIYVASDFPKTESQLGWAGTFIIV